MQRGRSNFRFNLSDVNLGNALINNFLVNNGFQNMGSSFLKRNDPYNWCLNYSFTNNTLYLSAWLSQGNDEYVMDDINDSNSKEYMNAINNLFMSFGRITESSERETPSNDSGINTLKLQSQMMGIDYEKVKREKEMDEENKKFFKSIIPLVIVCLVLLIVLLIV